MADKVAVPIRTKGPAVLRVVMPKKPSSTPKDPAMNPPTQADRTATPSSSAGDATGTVRATAPVPASSPQELQDTLQTSTTTSTMRPLSRTTHWDVHAQTYVPEILLATTHQAPAHSVDTLSGTEKYDFARYIQTFAGTDFLRAQQDPIIPAATTLHKSDTQPAYPPTPMIYASTFHSALTTEFSAQDLQYRQSNLFNVRLQRHDNSIHTFTLHLPGLEEDIPRLELGDAVGVRLIRLGNYGEPYGWTEWTYNKQMPVPCWDGVQYNAKVSGINRRLELIVLEITGIYRKAELLVLDMYDRPLHSLACNIVFGRSERRSIALLKALSSVDEAFTTITDPMDSFESSTNSRVTSTTLNPEPHTLSRKSTHDTQWLRQMLFPEVRDGILQYTLNAGAAFPLFDTMLNFEQQKAVDAVRKRNYGNVPYLISGPPGTGKTKTLVEIALQLVASPDAKMKHILICAPSDPAADTIAQRLTNHLSPHALLRLHSFSRTFPEVPDALMTYSYIDNDSFALPPFRQLMKYKIVVTTCRDADILLSARLTNRDLYQLEEEMFHTYHDQHEGFAFKTRLHWEALLIDEGAQATEPEVLLSLLVVNPPATSSPPQGSATPPAVVVAGDERQLGPRTASKAAALEASLLERLFQLALYKEHPFSRHNTQARAAPPVLRREMLPIIRPPFCNLVRNYRSHPAILAVPSSLFYWDTLIPEARMSEDLVGWDWEGRGWPVLFVENHGADEMKHDGAGWYNSAEAALACSLAVSLIRNQGVREEDICIMSPFWTQVRRIRDVLRKDHQLWRVNVGPTEAFQGLESKVVILCTTRARQRFLEQDRARGLGIVHEPKRMNVALTRAKEGLVVIGNPNVLALDEHWRAFMGFCWRNELWRGQAGGVPGRADTGADTEAWQPPDDGVTLSRLERALIHEEEPADDGTRTAFVGDWTVDGDDAIWASGLAAEEAVRSEEEEDEA